MKKIISIFLVLCLIFSMTSIVFATPNTNQFLELHSSQTDTSETVLFMYEGDAYTFFREEVGGKVFASITNSNGNVLTAITLDKNENTLYNEVEKIFYETSEMNCAMSRTAIEDLPYAYSGTTQGSVDTGDGVFVAATILAALAPGVAIGVIIEIVGYFIQKDCPTIYYEIDFYMYSDNQYDYVKRVLSMYEKSNYTSQLGDSLTGYQKKSNQ